MFLQYLIIVKMHRVFSSKNKLLGSAPTFEFHRIKKYDSLGVIIGIMQDYIYEPRNFATLLCSGITQLFTK